MVHGRTHARSGTIPDITWDVVYGPTAGGIAVSRSATVGITPALSGSCRFDEVQFAPTPEQEFTMGHYGMDDPYAPADPWGSRLVGSSTGWPG